MIYALLQEREPFERKAILKIIGLLLFKKPPMSENSVEFLEKLSAFSALENDEIDAVMRIDIRDTWDFGHIIDEVLSTGSQKLLYFLVKLTENCFKAKGGVTSFMSSSEESSFIEKEITPHIQIGDKAKTSIAKTASEFFTASCNTYNTIYETSLSKKELESVAPSEKVFMLNVMKLNELSSKQLGHFLSVFNHHVISKHSDPENSAEAMFLHHFLGAVYERAGVAPSEVVLPTLEDYLKLEQIWLKNLVLMASLANLDAGENPMKNVDIKKMSHTLEVDAKTIEKRLFAITTSYKTACVAAFECLHESSHNNYSLNDTTTDYMRTAVFVADIATDFVPGVAVAKRFYMRTQKVMEVVDNLQNDDIRNIEKALGLRKITNDSDSYIINICIDGFMSESSKGQFSEWKDALEILGVQGTLMGFAWPSSNYLTISAASWPNAVKNTAIYGEKLAEDIKLLKVSNPKIEINLYGHSLGGRIIHNALITLLDSGCKVNKAYIFGGAVSRVDKHKWSGALQSVEKEVYNFYSLHDDILKRLYRAAQVGDEAVGLGEIEYYNNKDTRTCTVNNINASDDVGGHTEYKKKLVRLLGDLKETT
tara:strand:- start:1105 stop:2889 length:1785 start_codon:yes stop_codon:yes gene_type:complete